MKSQLPHQKKFSTLKVYHWFLNVLFELSSQAFWAIFTKFYAILSIHQYCTATSEEGTNQPLLIEQLREMVYSEHHHFASFERTQASKE